MADSSPSMDANLDGKLPEVTFSTFVISLGSSALVQLGEVPDPASGKKAPNPLMAKHIIDTLTMLQAKTANGLTKDEKSLLDSLLYELKMKYVCLCENKQ